MWQSVRQLWVPFGAITRTVFPADGSLHQVKLVRIRVPFGCHWRWCIVDDEQPRIGTMTDRGGGRWRLQVAVDPDPVSGERRRLSRTVQARDRRQGRPPAYGRRRGRRPLWRWPCKPSGTCWTSSWPRRHSDHHTAPDWVSVTDGHLKARPRWRCHSGSSPRETAISSMPA